MQASRRQSFLSSKHIQPCMFRLLLSMTSAMRCMARRGQACRGAPEGIACCGVEWVVQGGLPVGVLQRRFQIMPHLSPDLLRRPLCVVMQVPPCQLICHRMRAVPAAKAPNLSRDRDVLQDCRASLCAMMLSGITRSICMHLYMENATSQALMQKETPPSGKGAQGPALLCQRRPGSELTYKQ